MEIAVWSRFSGGEIKDYVLDMLVLRVLLNMLISYLDTLAWSSAKWVAYICKFDINHLHASISPWGFPGGSVVKNQPAKQAMQEMRIRSLGCDYPLEKKMSTHSSIPAWKIPWTEEPGGVRTPWL